MRKNWFWLLTLPFTFTAYAQVLAIQPESEPTDNPNGSKADSIISGLRDKIDVNLLLRSSLEIPSGSQNQGGVRLNEARLEVWGALLPNLSYRVRYRLNRSASPLSQDNASGSIDHASATYHFGRNRNWNLTAGKQSAMVGSWEFDNNPTFEYQYSEYVNRQLNLFLTAVKLNHNIHKNHTLSLQLHNTSNHDFANTLQSANYSENGLKASKLPVGIYVSWLGNVFDNKFQTFYSYNYSQFAQGKANHSVSLGNKLNLNRFNAYLDLATSTYGVEHFNISSPVVNAYRLTAQPGARPGLAQNINYKNAILRLDYEFTPGWFVTAKGIWESASNRDITALGTKFRTNTAYLAGLEYKPVKSQDMRLFTYYYTNEINVKNGLDKTSVATRQNVFAVGMLYYLTAL